jgi:hypothetical protein
VSRCNSTTRIRLPERSAKHADSWRPRCQATSNHGAHSNCRIRAPVPKARYAQAYCCEGMWPDIERGRAYVSRLCSLRTGVAPRSCLMRAKMMAMNQHGPARARTRLSAGLPARQMRFSSVPCISAENGPAILIGAGMIGDSGVPLPSRRCSRGSEHRA